MVVDLLRPHRVLHLRFIESLLRVGSDGVWITSTVCSTADRVDWICVRLLLARGKWLWTSSLPSFKYDVLTRHRSAYFDGFRNMARSGEQLYDQPALKSASSMRPLS